MTVKELKKEKPHFYGVPLLCEGCIFRDVCLQKGHKKTVKLWMGKDDMNTSKGVDGVKKTRVKLCG